MDTDYYAQIEIALDDLRTRVKALENVAVQRPEVIMQPDPSRPPGVIVEPLPLNGL